MTRSVITAPQTEALTLADVQAQLKAYGGEMDAQSAYYTRLIVAARLAAEGELRRPLLPQTCKATSDTLMPPLRLWNDVTAVESVTYFDKSGASQTLDTEVYRLRDGADLVPKGWHSRSAADGGLYWEHPRNPWPHGTNVIVQFQAGAWATPDDVPEAIKAWMLLNIGALDANRAIAGSVQTFALAESVTSLYLRPYIKEAL